MFPDIVSELLYTLGAPTEILKRATAVSMVVWWDVHVQKRISNPSQSRRKGHRGLTRPPGRWLEHRQQYKGR